MIFPFYHTVSEESLDHIKHLYIVKNAREFENDLDFLLTHYEPVGLKQVQKCLHGLSGGNGFNFMLSFDDGLREFKDIIAPILLRKGIPAVCFLNSGFLDNKNLFYRHKVSLLIERLNLLEQKGHLPSFVDGWFEDHHLSRKNPVRSLKQVSYSDRYILDELAALIDVNFEDYLKEIRPYLTTEDVKSLISQGFMFGAHSIDHPPFFELNEIEQQYQLEESLAEVTSILELDYRVFSFPFSDAGVSRSLFKAVLEGDSPLADITFGTNGLKREQFERHIQRIPMEKQGRCAQSILIEEFLRFIVRAILNKNNIVRS